VTLELFVSSAPGLEEMVAEEARAAGASSPRVVPGGVELAGDRALLYRLSFELGVAIAILVRLGRFRARRFDALEKEAARIEWERWIAPGAPVEVRAKCRKSRLHHSGAVEERVLRAIHARLGQPGQAGGARDRRAGAEREVAGDERLARVHVRLDHDECTLSFDAAGEPLHRRGYRLATAKAPLREDLARALVKLSGWDPRTPLLDPFAGSGTICIEAAWLARGLPPGHMRRFAFERAPSFDAAVFRSVRERATERVLDRPPAAILGSDRDEGAVRAARENAARAGVGEHVRFEVAPLSTSPIFDGPLTDRGALVTNPPYGLRVGRTSTLESLYRALGDRARTLPSGFSVAFVVADPNLARKTGLDLEQKLLTDHGGTKVRVLVSRPR
jgi:putative N6-adenine-specific DNA methylase